MYSDILKAYVPTGKPRGRPKGSKNGQHQAKPVSPSHASNFPSENPLGAGTFKNVGEAFGGTSFTPNVMLHNSKANAENHEGFIHGHLTDSGYKHIGRSTAHNITTSTYEHANGDKVMINNGISGGKSFLGYHHTPAEKKNPSDSPKEQPKETPKEDTKNSLPMGAKPKREASAVGTDGKVDANKFSKGIAKIADLTDVNDHNNALAHGAKLLGRQDIADKAKEISRQHLKAGHMTQELMSQRNNLHQELDKHAKKVLSPEQHHQFHMSY